MKIYLFLLSLIVLIASCSSTKEMQVNVARPMVFKLPSNVRKAVFVNRSKGSALNILEGALTGEFFGVDKTMSEACIAAMANVFITNSSIKVETYDGFLKKASTSPKSFGKNLDHAFLDSLQQNYNADIAIVLEYFDSDYTIRSITQPNNMGAVMFSGFVNVDVGIRIYSTLDKSILFEQSYRRGGFYGEAANNTAVLLAKRLYGTNALKRASVDVGTNVGRKFVQYRLWEDRVIFKGHSDATTQAVRLIIAGQHQMALDILQKAYDATNKVSRKASIAHNIAYCFEVLNDLSQAEIWATDAYALSASKQSLQYLNIIKRRIREQDKLE
jgi:hypothetical protein